MEITKDAAPMIALISLGCPKNLVNSEEMLFKTIQGAFSQRRKTLLNSLSSYFTNIPKNKLQEAILSLGFEESIRGEKLTIEDFCILSDKLGEIK